MKRGFTVLELLVASLLLSMLVTMLSMMFNQSSIAWRTGVAGVVELNQVRQKMGAFHDTQDEILPGLGQNNAQVGASDNREIKYRNVSLWKKNAKNTLRTGQRAFDTFSENGGSAESQMASMITLANAQRGTASGIGGSTSGQGVNAFIVGVQSAGPNREFEDEDDITNWPEDVD